MDCVENKRTDQTKGADMDRAMELRINAQKCAINSSSTITHYHAEAPLNGEMAIATVFEGSTA